jgi:cyanate lyase
MGKSVVMQHKRVTCAGITLTFIAVMLGMQSLPLSDSLSIQPLYAAGSQQALGDAVAAHVVGAAKADDKGIQRMTRQQATELILAAKKVKGLTWEQIAKEVGASTLWVTSALLGQNSMNQEQAEKAVKMLGLGTEVADLLKEFPMKGSLDKTVPVDPLIYRFHEITQVYGTTLKEVIQEKFGDGIMSAIDFEIDIQKKEDPKGDRVIIIFNGKFLPYKKW